MDSRFVYDTLYSYTVILVAIVKVSVIRTRVRGVLLPKGRLSREPTYDGELSISTTRDNRLNRISKTAKLLRVSEKMVSIELLDVNLEWVNEGRLVLTGFEPCEENGIVTDYAQSWLCLVGIGRRLKTESEEYVEQQVNRARLKPEEVVPGWK